MSWLLLIKISYQKQIRGTSGDNFAVWQCEKRANQGLILTLMMRKTSFRTENEYILCGCVLCWFEKLVHNFKPAKRIVLYSLFYAYIPIQHLKFIHFLNVCIVPD